jgi:hypothetical protein
MNDVAAISNDSRRGLFLAFIEEYLDADQAVAAAVGNRKDLRKRVKGAGISLAQFDRVRKEAEKSGSVRETEFREFCLYMMWLGKPLGFQGTLFTEHEEAAPPREVSEHQVQRVQIDGKQASAQGRSRDTNPWTPGTYLYQVWDQNWLAAEDMKVPPVEAAPNLTASGRRRGRPPGSRNKPKVTLQ